VAERQRDKVGSQEPEGVARALGELARELERARKKHPQSRYLVYALAEELGEAAATGRLAYQPGNVEWLHVACVAMRLYEEGSVTQENHVLVELLRVGLEAKARLD